MICFKLYLIFLLFICIPLISTHYLKNEFEIKNNINNSSTNADSYNFNLTNSNATIGILANDLEDTEFKKNSTTHSISHITDDKIVNGSPASIRRFSYQVAVLIPDSLCGGTLIRYRWVVTAQHCVRGIKARDVEIRAGSRKFYAGGVIAKVNLIVNHGGYSTSTLNNDISLLRMRRGFRNFRGRYPIRPIGMVGRLPPDGAKLVVSGYGTLSSGGSLPRYLQKVVLRKINFSTCKSSYGALTKNQLCAGYLAGGKDSCQGDSGGPLVYKRRLLGVVSFGNGCASPNFPGVYTSIPEFKSWVLSVLKKY